MCCKKKCPVRNSMFPKTRLSVKILIRYGSSFIFICFLVEYFGVLTHFFEESYRENFHYPYDVDVTRQCYLLRHAQKPEVEPINNQTYSYRHNNERKCKDEFKQSPLNPHLMIVVKSRIDHFDRREAIRNSWGLEERFSDGDVPIRTVFLLGIDKASHKGRPSEVQKLVDIEAEQYQDIIQFNFIDEYFNLTIKTMNGIRWCIDNCIRSKFYLLVDDDFLVSMKNILAFLRNPISYPAYTNDNEMELPPDVKLFAGFVINSSPHRHKISKWFVKLSEYKYDKWPPYVTGGVMLMSREALQEMYCASFYTQHFRFDDIFLALVAQKALIEPLHSKEFHFYKAIYNGPASYRYVLASHGYDDPDEMLKVWNEVKASGYA